MNSFIHSFIWMQYKDLNLVVFFFVNKKRSSCNDKYCSYTSTNILSFSIVQRKKNQFSPLHRSITMISYIQMFIYRNLSYNNGILPVICHPLWLLFFLLLLAVCLFRFVVSRSFSISCFSFIHSFSNCSTIAVQKFLLIRCWLVTIANTWIYTYTHVRLFFKLSPLFCRSHFLFF